MLAVEGLYKTVLSVQYDGGVWDIYISLKETSRRAICEFYLEVVCSCGHLLLPAGPD